MGRAQFAIPGDRVIPAEAGDPGALELVLLGRAIADTEVRIVDDQGKSLPAGTVGRVLIRGPSVTTGYYDNPAANTRALLGDGWVDTRDLGFTHQAQLVITGRVDDLIFINGQNFYPQDIEAVLIEAIELLDLNKLAAGPVRLQGDESDRLAIFVLHRGRLEALVPVAREITAALSRELGIVATVIPVPQIPKTTSGKLQRKQLTSAANRGEFDSQLRALGDLLNAPAAASGRADAIAEQLLAVCRDVIKDREIGADDNLFEIELSSLDLAQVFEEIEQRFSVDLEITDLFDYPTANDLARYLAEQVVDA